MPDFSNRLGAASRAFFDPLQEGFSPRSAFESERGGICPIGMVAGNGSTRPANRTHSMRNAGGPPSSMQRWLVVLAVFALLLPVAAWLRPAQAGRSNTAHVQVLVVGRPPAGIAAAVAAARAGMTTLLVEPREEIGGDITLVWLNVLDLSVGPVG